MTQMLELKTVGKRFTLHTQGETVIPVFKDVNFSLQAGDCVALSGPSGSGKSTLMRMIYGNYVCHTGVIRMRHKDDWIDIVGATPHAVLSARRHTIGYVSQFLRVIPRVPALDIVAEPLIDAGEETRTAMERAKHLLTRLNVPEHLWSLSPMTFSGGEQQRVNIARGFAVRYPIILLDEPTASLDTVNKEVVLTMIEEARDSGAAILGIFHDQEARERVCNRAIDVTDFQEKAYA